MPVSELAAKPKLALTVARQLEDDIAELGWPVGEVIASENDLIERYDVSRAVLREAIRIVEHTGAARMRRGPGGGLVVDAPRREVVASTASVYFSSVGVTVVEIADALDPITIAAVEIATHDPDPPGLRRVVAFMDEMAAHRRLGADDFIELRERVIALCGNAVLDLFVEALGEISSSRLRGTRAVLEPRLTIDDALRHLQGYRRAIEAIGAGEVEHAVEAMRALQQGVRRRLKDRAPQARQRTSAAPVEVNGKLAERVARLIREDIERAGWEVGALLGSESEVVERYEVSRAVLREAVRILEFLGVVSTRRGPGGGLFISQPDAGAIVHSARVIIDYEQVDAQQIWDAREIVEEAVLRLAADRLDADGVEHLRATLVEEGAAGESAIRDHLVHHALAEASQNRPLVFFVDALAELSLTRAQAELRSKPNVSLPTSDAHRAHELIVDALERGDGDKAVDRMRRHLRAASTSYRNL